MTVEASSADEMPPEKELAGGEKERMSQWANE